MIEPRLESAKPSEWTTVSKDDALMRKLLAAFFTHEYHLSPAFYKDYFLEDMAVGQKHRTKNMCCSSLLVNAVLAWACCCCENIPNRFKYWCPENLGYRFFAEAKRIWEMQMVTGENRNLTSIQAAMVMNIYLNLSGLDKLGDLYGVRGIEIAKEMRLFDGNADVASERLRHARNFTAWCVFSIDVQLSLLFFRPALLSSPPQFKLPGPAINPNCLDCLIYLWTVYLEYLRSSLSLALKGLREQGRNYYLARTVYYIVRNQIQPEDRGLLMGAEDRESADDESPGLFGEVHSSWVARSVDISENTATEELSYLAKQYLTLETDE
ncbi:hypothetical protein E8E13_011043 [Curvularia kusanoi]|uniref:Xylanolytic transcriptional activator regulatory domain-containing protein n=1 Tax=Curvularia kusanoi TaxID=90978 RepID=A0A9P4WBN0_CURKU|nr:hypothetical protein E8E13_011043 [Curvularia kusanoi]